MICMTGRHLFVALLSVPLFAADPVLVLDRGLPQANLNHVSPEYRSNIRWSWYDHGFVGDDFSIGGAGERWVIDAIRTWTVPGTQAGDPQNLGDYYQDVRLYFGAARSGVTPVATAELSTGSDETANPNIRLTEITGSGVVPYNEFGKDLRVWQVDFQNLQLVVDGGTTYRFGVWGMGRPIPGNEGKTYPWFNHGSNAPLSIARQEGADGVLLLFDSGGRYEGTFNAKGGGWDKAADINVQVFAHRAGPVHRAR